MAALTRHTAHDVDDQAEALTGWDQHYEQLSCGRFRGELWHLALRDGFLVREQTNRQLREQIAPPDDHVVLALPLAVQPGSVYAGRALDRDTLMVLPGGREVDVVSAGELDLIGLAVHREMLERTLAPAKREWLQQAENERNLGLSPDSAQAIRQMLLAVCGEAEDALGQPASDRRESELLAMALNQAVLLAMGGDRSGPQGSTIPRRADSRLKVVQRAIDFMRAHLEQDIGVGEICAAAFASRRSLQYCFEEFMHTTPQAYLRALRLNEARRALKLCGDPASKPITELASMLGFSSASHFTRHYKAMFDELPSETLRQYQLVP
ncbi:helix-turn-helix domain-containing protein [Ideonella sp. 4Y16]|uniref:helix-turn-helix domain-containing protein n=1 Tax=Ideonella alba TaxID=2824118 RepID=UPI001B36A2DE|nr:helix-turn-helix domain-containing protein [Ideonella alba]MBQ0944544.1 helix-turn-helix domain-containing protein [Ideonella alba]